MNGSIVRWIFLVIGQDPVATSAVSGFGSVKYEASLCTDSTMLLLLYVRIASGWLAT